MFSRHPIFDFFLFRIPKTRDKPNRNIYNFQFTDIAEDQWVVSSHSN